MWDAQSAPTPGHFLSVWTFSCVVTAHHSRPGWLVPSASSPLGQPFNEIGVGIALSRRPRDQRSDTADEQQGVGVREDRPEGKVEHVPPKKRFEGASILAKGWVSGRRGALCCPLWPPSGGTTFRGRNE